MPANIVSEVISNDSPATYNIAVTERDTRLTPSQCKKLLPYFLNQI
jgi:hypothetical protein